MSRYFHIPIFQQGYDLNLQIYRTTHNFPREYKYTLGQELKKVSSELLDYIVKANQKRDKDLCFAEIRSRIERLRIYFRTAYDLKIIRIEKFTYFSRTLEMIAKQNAGWENWFFDKKREVQ